MMQKTDSAVISHWHTLFEDFSTSTQEFYRAVEESVRSRNLPEVEVSRMLFNEGGIGTAQREYLRVQRKRVAFDICSAPYGNGHFFSWWLARIPPRYGVFAAIGILFLALGLTWILHLMLRPMLPDGYIAHAIAKLVLWFVLYPLVLLVMGYFVEQGTLGDEEWVMSLPILGRLYVFVFNPLTYYRQDTAMMFRDSIRSAVNEVIHGVRQEKGLRGLGEDELQPMEGAA